jgi:hypothetical protein
MFETVLLQADKEFLKIYADYALARKWKKGVNDSFFHFFINSSYESFL